MADSKEELLQFRRQATEIMEEGSFTLHKRHSNAEYLQEKKGIEQKVNPTSEGQEEHSTSKILGVTWNRAADVLRVGFRSSLSANAPLTKRKMLAIINGVYEILGWVSPGMITVKILFSKLFLKGITWGEIVPYGSRESLAVKQSHCQEVSSVMYKENWLYTGFQMLVN